MMTFSDFVHKHILKNKATSNMEIQEVLPFLGLNDVRFYLRDGPFEPDVGIVNLHPSKGTLWVCYINENYFDLNGCVCPKKLFNFNIKRNGHCLYSEYQIQKNDSFCASYCLLIIYLTEVIDIDFKSAVLILYYRRFS